MSAKKALVVGGASGIGLEISAQLLSDGIDVTILHSGRRNNFEEEIIAECPDIVCDLRRSFDVERLCKNLSGEKGAYDILIYNSGISYDVLVPLVETKKVSELFEVNYFGFVKMVTAILPHMMRKRFGRIVYMSSVAAGGGNQGNAIYASSKAAGEAYVKTVAVEMAKRNITANCVAPGFVNTPMLAKYDEHKMALLQHVPANRYAEPHEVARLVAFLVQPSAGYINGSVLGIDGGIGARTRS